MFFRKLSRIYAGGLIGASLFALGVACEQTGDPPPSQSDDLATADIATGPDLTPYNTPVVSSVLPNSGANNVATSITVSGTDFRPGAQVTVGGTACTNVVVTSPTTTWRRVNPSNMGSPALAGVDAVHQARVVRNIRRRFSGASSAAKS